MKRTRCDSTCDQPAKKAKHKIEYDKHWREEFPWHVPVYIEEGNSESCVVGLLCSICQRHGTKQRNRAGIWTDKPCTYLRKDILPLSQFNFERAADIWATLRNRRLHVGVSSASSSS